MKKSSRGGAGQGPKKGKSQGSKSDQKRGQGSARSAGGGRFQSASGDEGADRSEREKRSSDDDSGAARGKGKQRREIKNARGLKDVLGLGAKSKAPTGQRFSPGRGAAPETASGRPSKGPLSQKLTYITNFQPPSGSASEAGQQPNRVKDIQEESRSNKQNNDRENRRSRVPKDAGMKSPHAQRSNQENQTESRNAARAGNSKNQPSAPRADREERASEAAPPGRAPEASASSPSPRGTAKTSSPANNQSRTDFSWPKKRVTPLTQPEVENRASKRTGRRSDVRFVQGIVKRHPDGYGFLIVDDADTPDVYIARQSMNGIMTNDRVEAEIFQPKSFRGAKGGKEDRLAGEIVKVLARANKRVVGRYLPVDQKYGVVQDDGRGWGADLRIATYDAMDAKENDLVAVEVLQYPGDDQEFTGRVVEIIGDVEDPVNDVIRVVHEKGIPMEFSREAVADARRFGGKVTDEERKGREDLTGLNLITIDGATAKDFDDAVYTEQTKDGFKLVVAIADVSHYVKPGTRLDEEAYERGTSTYFPNFVVPMLPEELSNELCSLKPHVPRLCFVCEMKFNWNGDVEDYRFFEGVMESKARVTYGEAQEVVDGRNPAKLNHVADNILKCADLAKILMAKRFREGSLDLEIPETQVVVDGTGETSDIIRSERLFAHRLIEELMLVTNICTAKFLDKAEIPGIYRIHEEPDPDNIEALQRYLWNLGGNRSVMGGGLAKKLTQALEQMSGQPQAQILNILTLRTMKQAQYSERNVGHFGLGFSHYSHFTSPIRRYPDLIAHRIIKSQLYPRYGSMQMSDEEIASATTWLSACEQRSVKAERKVISIKKARFMMKHVGEEFDGIISSVAKFGVFVLLRQYDVDGLVKIERLGQDRFTFDEENLSLTGSRTGLRYGIGDQVRVRVAAANPEEGRIDLVLASDIEEARDSNEPDEQTQAGAGRSSKGSKNKKKEHARGARTAPKSQSQLESGAQPKSGSGNARAGGKKRGSSEERGPIANDPRDVRKKRVSKRRGKN